MAAADPPSMLVSRNVTVAGRRTSIRLEPEMWDSLAEIAWREGVSVHQIATVVDGLRRASSLTAKLRVYILGYFRAAATEAGHASAGHGAGRPARAPAPRAVRDTLHDEICARIAALVADPRRRPRRRGS